MEERVPPPGDSTTSSPLPPGRDFTGKDDLPLPLPPGRSETYVVQIPRDQIYRVPPSENAIIVESYRKTTRQNNPGKCTSCRTCFIISITTLAIVIALIFGHMRFLYNPKSPQFDVTKFVAKKQRNHKMGYEISIKSTNPNERMGVSYKKSGEISLFFKKYKMGKGEFPSFHQETKNLTTSRVTLAGGSHVALPKEIEKSMKGTKSKMKKVLLSVKIKVAVKFTSWMKNVSKDLIVTCDFRVDTLAKGTRILFQECRTKM